MQSFWLKFEDGSKACCQGQSAYDALRIAEHLSKKKVAAKPGAQITSWSAEGREISPLPYPAEPSIWKFEHPEYGKTPSFCHSPNKCAGRGSCPQAHACDD